MSKIHRLAVLLVWTAATSHLLLAPVALPAQIPGLPTSYPAVHDFALGTMGGHYTVQQSIQKIDSLITAYPTLLSNRISLGNSFNGQSIWYVRMSDNPTVDEDEPEILYTALMHSNEPLSMMQVYYYMCYLLQNYGINPDITYLLDHRELYFLPVLNPDGLLTNSHTHPNGQGPHRRTGQHYWDQYDRRYETGMDINRSFLEHWTAPRVRFPSDWSSDYFQGNYPYESWEARYLKNLCLERQFKIAVNAHGDGRMVVLPWNWSRDQLCPDSSVYQYYANQLTSINAYHWGLAYQLQFESADSRDGFASRGTVDDWMYAETVEKDRIFAWSLVTGRGYYPTPDSIVYFSEETITSNLFAAWAAGPFVQLLDHHITDPLDQDSYVDPGGSGQIIVSVQNSGRIVSQPALLHVSVNDTNIVLQNATHNFSALEVFGQDSNTSNPLSFHVRPTAKTGDITQFILTLEVDGLSLTDSIEFIVGTPSVLFSDSARTLAQWDTANTMWGIVQDPLSGDHRLTDSPMGVYLNHSDNMLAMSTNLDLSSVVRPWLAFRTKWDIEKLWDIGTMALSTDDGLSWINLRGRHTVPASGKPGPQANRSVFGFDGLQEDWVDEFVDLRQWQGAPGIRLRFRLQADGWVVQDGWYVDDVLIRGFVRPPAGAQGVRPREFELLPNAPNPFNPSTHIRFRLLAPSPVTIEIFNILGQRVRRLTFTSAWNPGLHSIEWRGDNDVGHQVSSGIYVCRLSTNYGIQSRKMILIK